MKPFKLLLINVGKRRPMYPSVTPPLGIMYLAAYLREKMPCEVQLINQKIENLSRDRIVKMAGEYGPDVIGLSALTPTSFGLRPMTRALRERLPDALQILGGPHVSAFKEMALADSAADVAVSGEGELAIEQVINAHFEGDGDLSEVPGVYRRDEEGNVIQNPGSIPLIDNPDDLPFPAYDLIDLPSYWEHPSIANVLDRKYVSLFSSRGCPYKCNYCHDVFGKRFRQHTAQRIVDEVEYFQKKYGVKEFEFLDDIFNLNPKRLFEYCDLIQKKNIKIKMAFPNGVRTDIFKRESLDAIIDAGMYFACFALESGSPRIQEVMRKGLDIDRFVENVGYATSRGVYSQGFAMMGFPTETEEEMEMTADVACGSALHSLSVFTVTPYPNTELYEVAMKKCPEQVKKIDYQNMDYISAFINLSEVPDDRLFYQQRRANQRFFMSPRRAFRILRDYPNRKKLPGYIAHYLPHFISRTTKGMFSSSKQRVLEAV